MPMLCRLKPTAALLRIEGPAGMDHEPRLAQERAEDVTFGVKDAAGTPPHRGGTQSQELRRAAAPASSPRRLSSFGHLGFAPRQLAPRSSFTGTVRPLSSSLTRGEACMTIEQAQLQGPAMHRLRLCSDCGFGCHRCMRASQVP